MDAPPKLDSLFWVTPTAPSEVIEAVRCLVEVINNAFGLPFPLADDYVDFEDMVAYLLTLYPDKGRHTVRGYAANMYENIDKLMPALELWHLRCSKPRNNCRCEGKGQLDSQSKWYHYPISGWAKEQRDWVITRNSLVTLDPKYLDRLTQVSRRRWGGFIAQLQPPPTP